MTDLKTCYREKKATESHIEFKVHSDDYRILPSRDREKHQFRRFLSQFGEFPSPSSKETAIEREREGGEEISKCFDSLYQMRQ